MTAEVAEEVLDDPTRLAEADPGQMLRAVASGGAQVRTAATLAGEASLDRLAADGRPRAVCVLGMGGSGIAGDVLAAVAGPGCPVPVVGHRGYGLPGWVGPADLVAAVSCSGTTEETVSGLEDAVRRGCRVVGVGAAGSPVEDVVRRLRGPFIPAQAEDRQPRSMIWALSVPLLLAGAAAGLLTVSDEELAATADRLDQLAERCRPSSDSFVNPAKSLATELSDSLPLIWGAGPLAGVAAYRAVCQLAENAKYPALSGVLPEANHNQVVALDGTYAGAAAAEDFFHDRVDDDTRRLHLVLLRDPPGEHAQVARRANASAELARDRGVPVTELTAEGNSRLERLAALIGLLDFASVYLAILTGVDPTPVSAIDELKARIRP